MSQKTTIRILNILHDSVVDGEGFRTTIFTAGCPHGCPGCHNPESWDFKGGKEMTIDEIIAELESNPMTDVTLSGGDPFAQAKGVSELAKRIKELGKNIWIYSGYTYEEILNHPNKYFQELLNYCDVLVDGKFIMELRDPTLPFRGSSNQRIIHLDNHKPD